MFFLQLQQLIFLLFSFFTHKTYFPGPRNTLVECTEFNSNTRILPLQIYSYGTERDKIARLILPLHLAPRDDGFAFELTSPFYFPLT